MAGKRSLVRIPGWTRLSVDTRVTCYGRWRHDSSGWRVEHCGHPTANWPYLILRPDGDPIVAPNAHGFRTLKLAMQAVELHHAKPPEMQYVFDAIGQRYCVLPAAPRSHTIQG